MRVHPTGKVTVFTGSHSHGQGHETTFAQVVADKLGIPMEDITIEHGDTGKVLFGMGTYGSRSLAVGGTAIVKAVDKIDRQGQEDRRPPAGGGRHRHRVRGRRVQGGRHRQGDARSPQVSLTAYVPHNFPHDKLEPGLNENAFYDPSNFTYPAGTYICEVEIDPATGVTRIDRMTACDDFGNVINPMIVEGQVHGGLAQGIGQALLEHGVYDTRDRPAAHRQLHGLRDAARRRPAQLHRRDRHGHALHAQPAGREGLRRGRRDRLAAGGDQRHLRCPGRQGRADAGHALHCVASRPAPRRAEPARRHNTMQAFAYTNPASVADAASAAAADDAKILAGGQSLLPSMKLGLAAPDALIDLGGIADLKGITVAGGVVKIGAMTTHAEVAANADVQKAIPALAELAGNIGDRQVRNRGTHRRQPGQQRPGRLLPGRRAGPGRHRAHQPAHDRRRRLLHRPVRDRAEPKAS